MGETGETCLLPLLHLGELLLELGMEALGEDVHLLNLTVNLRQKVLLARTLWLEHVVVHGDRNGAVHGVLAELLDVSGGDHRRKGALELLVVHVPRLPFLLALLLDRTTEVHHGAHRRWSKLTYTNLILIMCYEVL